MSIPVELQNLAEVMTRYRFAYLLTASAHGAPHAVAVVPILEGSVLAIDGIGRRTRNNLIQQPAVGLVWPPREESDYSLIVDGQAAPDGELLRITPSRAVLHRHPPARRPDAVEQGACGSDCVELKIPTDATDVGRP